MSLRGAGLSNFCYPLLFGTVLGPHIKAGGPRDPRSNPAPQASGSPSPGLLFLNHGMKTV